MTPEAAKEPAAQPPVRIWKAYKPAPDILKAQKSAAGIMPAGAFQYCEAMRVASGYGWYIYPPKDVSLFFDGRESYFHEDDQWFPIKSTQFEPEFQAHWNENAPEDLAFLNPPFITELFVPGGIQIWSGYFVETAPGWSLHVRSPVNYDIRSSISHYEGIIETADFKPCPLFINFKIVKTDTEIFLPRDRPLFQMQPILRESYTEGDRELAIASDFDDPDAPFDWDSLRGIMRKASERDQRRPGRYAADRRKIA